ncbi:uncharacterized protein C18orf19 homolog A [Amia ocellicauda]|uniref:uncharacterized protein C18orf19 homolog A n=1 Tax=Amia ocellicauda TaxID=2972642 RepID=UPI00346480F7
MQQFLFRGALQHIGATRSVLLRPALQQVNRAPAVVPCTRWSFLPPRWVSMSSAGRAAEQRKPNMEEDPRPPPPERPLGTAVSDPGHSTTQIETPAKAPVQEDFLEIDPLQDKSSGLFMRFKKTFKQYGKVMIPVHLITSTMWFGSFYYAAMKGVNVVPFLEFIGFPETLVNMLKNSQSGYALTAYAMYKIATPARYTVTLGGTSVSVKYLRKHGYMSTPPPVRDYIQDKMDETRERFSEKMEETKERFSERMEETKDRITETKDKLSGKLQETKDKVAFRRKKE